MKYRILVIAALFLTAGCQSSVAPSKVATQSNTKTLCKELPEFKGNTMGALYKYTVSLIESYTECKERHKALVESN